MTKQHDAGNTKEMGEVGSPERVYLFLCVFFSTTEELELALTFIKQKIGKYEYFSHNIRYEAFPLKSELFSVFYTGTSLPCAQVYYGKLIGLSSPINKKNLPGVINKINQFQKKIWTHQYYQIPIHVGYLLDSKVVSIYKKPGFISVDYIQGLHHQTELNYLYQPPHNHLYSLSVFKRKAYLTFFNDFRRLTKVI